MAEKRIAVKKLATRIVYSLTTLAALAMVLGAGKKWGPGPH
jgi:hypothetical protein